VDLGGDLASLDAAAGARVKIGGCGHRGEYIKGERQAEKGLLPRNARDLVALGRVRLGLKVGDDPDRWAPPVGDTEARGRPVSGYGEEGGGALLAGLALLALGREVGRAEKKGGRRRSRPRGKGEKWAEPDTGRRRGNSFPFSKFILCSNLLEMIFKIILNKGTPLNKIYAAA